MASREITRFSKDISIYILYVMLILLMGCSDESKNITTINDVKVSSSVEKKILAWDVYQGRFKSPNISSVLPRVSGLIVKAPFTEGSLVEKDSVLFEIDERPFLSDFLSREANYEKSRAIFNQKQTKFNRFKKLKDSNAISADEFESVEAEYKEAKADLEISKSEKAISKLELEWTKVKAPISGKVGKKLVTVGNLVNDIANSSAILTTITSIDPMYVSLDIPERKFLALRKNDNAKIPCEARLENQTKFTINGEINFIDNHVNRETGTIEMRCSFPNPSGILIEGLYAEVRILTDEPYDSILINDSSILTDQDSRYVLYVNKANIIERADVKLGIVFNNIRSITSGLKPDLRIITEGLQKSKVGLEVNVVENIPLDLSKSSDFLAE